MVIIGVIKKKGHKKHTLALQPWYGADIPTNNEYQGDYCNSTHLDKVK